MNAERLSEAATLLREQAGAAAPGPWTHETAPNGSPAIVISANDMVVADTYDKPHHADGTYIATMSPPVGLALADLLEHAAARATSKLSTGGNEHAVWSHEIDALNLADTILRNDS